ncbi:hypothetical protein [Leptospira santarosai]|uniref:hypothetical protein n=1 Tax=Leptospira santarosai TaxID=28183 RepID=UPI000376F495|nr:hypothetical protein [Leptospira santarosai]ASV12841.1 hypothetical protein B2G51_15770 [Leptospira santarosai]MDI7182156.1 hypothetical protein [Leptospira santarosai]MDO6381251.1 hypothetical protein [Leptospira santarosai]UZN07351.1 hypothetical protein M5D10_16520 [Leptospira santarosai]
MAKEYFGVTILRGLDHLYIKEKDNVILRGICEELSENIKLKGRITRESLEIQMTNKENPKNSDPIAMDSFSVYGCLLMSEPILVVLEELGFQDFKALPVILNHKPTKRNFNFWLFKCSEQLKFPLQKEVVCFHADRSTMVYFNKAAKEKIEALNPNCIKFVVPYNINEF